MPPIRPLLIIIFRRLVSTARSSSGTKQNDRSTELQSYTHSSKHRTRPQHVSRLGTVVGTKDSDESFLSLEEGIVKTTDIRLDFETFEGADAAEGTRESAEHGGRITPNERL